MKVADSLKPLIAGAKTVARGAKAVMRPYIWLLIGLAVIICAGLVGTYCYVAKPYKGQKVRIYIPQKATPQQVRDTLSRHLDEDYADRVGGFLDEDTGRMYGSYVVNPGDKALSVARRINQGRQTPVRFTFNNLRHAHQLAALAGRRLDIDSAEFMHEAIGYAEAHGLTEEQLPGLFLPDTYEMYWTAKPKEVMNTLYKAYKGFWTRARLAKADALGLTPSEVSTLASISEEESNDPAERGTIARVYLNRLHKGMRLQADPTVKYACGNDTARRVSGTMLANASPYNTYRHEGLPPGPIRIPEKATLDAVLNAPRHPYLYFCASPQFDGHHMFTASYSEHQANARRYQQALNARGIK